MILWDVDRSELVRYVCVSGIHDNTVRMFTEILFTIWLSNCKEIYASIDRHNNFRVEKGFHLVTISYSEKKLKKKLSNVIICVLHWTAADEHSKHKQNDEIGTSQ